MRASRMTLLAVGLLIGLGGVAALGYGALTMIHYRGLTQRIAGVVVRADAKEAVVGLHQDLEGRANQPPLSFSAEIPVSQAGRHPPLRVGERLTLVHPPHQPHLAQLDVSYTRPVVWTSAGGGLLLLAALLLVLTFRERKVQG